MTAVFLPTTHSLAVLQTLLFIVHSFIHREANGLNIQIGLQCFLAVLNHSALFGGGALFRQLEKEMEGAAPMLTRSSRTSGDGRESSLHKSGGVGCSGSRGGGSGGGGGGGGGGNAYWVETI